MYLKCYINRENFTTTSPGPSTTPGRTPIVTPSTTPSITLSQTTPPIGEDESAVNILAVIGIVAMLLFVLRLILKMLFFAFF
jgi:hypothetical protein